MATGSFQELTEVGALVVGDMEQMLYHALDFLMLKTCIMLVVSKCSNTSTNAYLAPQKPLSLLQLWDKIVDLHVQSYVEVDLGEWSL